MTPKEKDKNIEEIRYLKNMHTKGELAKMYLEAIQQTRTKIKEDIEKIIKNARETTFYQGVGHWTEDSDIDGVQEGITKIEKEILKSLEDEK